MSPESAFELAADAVVNGNIGTIEELLRENLDLIEARSSRPHRATLLHYVAANGVEDERQKTPANAVDIARVLLRAGAAVDATAEIYGGGSRATTLNLLVSSVHPARVGLQVPLLETLLDFGAAIDGRDQDGSPLMAALAFGYTEAAEALARRGARVDNIVTAAAFGREDLVEELFDSNADVQQAFVWAAMHRLKASAAGRQA